MLKIKDNVDLKELEKFGFLKQIWGYSICIDSKEENKRMFKIPDYNDFVFLTFYEDTREITLNFQNMEDYYFVDLSILYDLIETGLVEKVEE